MNAKLMLILMAAVICGACNGARSISPPSISPPIAFGACDANGVSQIVLAEPDGSQQQVITQGANPSWFPAWSPDGTQLLFVRDIGGAPQLWVMNADGSEPRGLVANGMTLGGSWSPDGTHIAYAYSATPTGGLKIWIAQTDGSQARRLTNVADATVNEYHPSWSPDGTQITFTSNQSGLYEIWVADVASGVAEPLTHAYYDPVLLANIEQKVPAWSPDGTLIAYWAGVEATDPRPNLPRNVWVMNADGTGQTLLVAGDDPNWSPTGEFIIHSMGGSDNPPAPALGIVRPDGTDATTLFAVNACQPLQSSWSGRQ